MRLVIAESNPALADILSFVARRRGHQSVCVPDPKRIFGSLPFTPTVAILSFPALDTESLDTVERLQDEFPDLPLLVTTETLNEPMPSKLMMAGAQDVIQIPYNPHEVILRAESRHVATGTAVDPDTVTVGDLAVNLAGYTAWKNGQSLTLTKLELRLLFCLGNHSPNVAPSERLLAFGWESTADEQPDMALLKTHISHLRKKIRQAGGQSISIVSRQSIGYQLSADAA